MASSIPMCQQMMMDQKVQFKKMQWNTKNLVMMMIEHLQVNQVSALNNP